MVGLFSQLLILVLAGMTSVNTQEVVTFGTRYEPSSQTERMTSRRGTIFLAYEVPRDGILYKLTMLLRTTEPVDLQLWRPGNNPRQFVMKFHKWIYPNEVNVSKSIFTVLNPSSNKLECPGVQAGDRLGLYSAGAMSIPCYRNQRYKHVTYKQTTTPPKVGTVVNFQKPTIPEDVRFLIMGFIYSDEGGTLGNEPPQNAPPGGGSGSPGGGSGSPGGGSGSPGGGSGFPGGGSGSPGGGSGSPGGGSGSPGGGSGSPGGGSGSPGGGNGRDGSSGWGRDGSSGWGRDGSSGGGRDGSSGWGRDGSSGGGRDGSSGGGCDGSSGGGRDGSSGGGRDGSSGGGRDGSSGGGRDGSSGGGRDGSSGGGRDGSSGGGRDGSSGGRGGGEAGGEDRGGKNNPDGRDGSSGGRHSGGDSTREKRRAPVPIGPSVRRRRDAHVDYCPSHLVPGTAGDPGQNEPQSGATINRVMYIGIGVAATMVMLIGVVICVVCCLKCRRRKRSEATNHHQGNAQSPGVHNKAFVHGVPGPGNNTYMSYKQSRSDPSHHQGGSNQHNPYEMPRVSRSDQTQTRYESITTGEDLRGELDVYETDEHRNVYEEILDEDVLRETPESSRNKLTSGKLTSGSDEPKYGSNKPRSKQTGKTDPKILTSRSKQSDLDSKASDSGSNSISTGLAKLPSATGSNSPTNHTYLELFAD